MGNFAAGLIAAFTKKLSPSTMEYEMSFQLDGRIMTIVNHSCLQFIFPEFNKAKKPAPDVEDGKNKRRYYCQKVV